MALAAVASFWMLSAALSAAPSAVTAHFEKVTDHYFLCQPSRESWNVGAVITDEGVLLIDPPAEADLATVQEALRRASPKAVKWVVHTDLRREIDGTASHFVRQGAVVLGSQELSRLVAEAAKPPGVPVAGNEPKPDEKRAAGNRAPRLTFDRQMRLFPSGVEVRILAVLHRARTAGDTVVVLPNEKVLQTGDLYTPAGFPEVDVQAGGSAGGWVDGLRQVVDAVPVLKAAIPQPRTEPVPKTPGRPPVNLADPSRGVDEERPLEESIAVVPGRGVASNLMEMKSLLESAQKLRSEIMRSKGRLNVSNAASLAPYRSLANFESFAALLNEEASRLRQSP
jgi:glyoxylase-like metal-dependent hydrolase (beta-lactamase superfamily II)